MMGSSKTGDINPKFNFLTHIKYEHLIAGVTGGVTSTLLLHPLDLLKIRFAGLFLTSNFSTGMGSSKSEDPYPKFNFLAQIKYEHLISGVMGGVTSSLLLHPLDLLNIRFSVNDGRTPVPQYHSLRNAVMTIFQQEGVKGLYKGVTPNVWGSGSAWGFYFLFYNSIKGWIQGGNTKTPLGPSMHMLAAAEAGVLTLVITNPVWVVKTRLCLQYGQETNMYSNKEYIGMIDALKKIYKVEGMRGLYKGFIPGMFGVSHGALQFMTYEELKNWYNKSRQLPFDAKMGTVEYLSFAALSKLFAAAVTYPYQVVRARLQDQHREYRGTWDCIGQTWRYEGTRGFYKGLFPYLLHVMPNICLVLLIYEKFTDNS